MMNAETSEAPFEHPAPVIKPPGAKKKKIFFIALAAIFLMCSFSYAHITCLFSRAYDLIRFGITPVMNAADYNHNLIDDYTDIMRGARKYIKMNPEYKDAYYQGGYPPEGEGVCTDVIWNAFQNAGYDLKAMVDEDVKANQSAYLGKKKQDTNIDFRRVGILNTFFKRNVLSLTTDIEQIGEWLAGDIVVYDGHIAIVSIRRNKEGKPYVIHHASYGCYEEDRLDYKRIVGHYRFQLTVNGFGWP